MLPVSPFVFILINITQKGDKYGILNIFGSAYSTHTGLVCLYDPESISIESISSIKSSSIISFL